MSYLYAFFLYLYSRTPSLDKYFTFSPSISSCQDGILLSKNCGVKKYSFGLGCLNLLFCWFSNVFLDSKAGKMIMYHLYASLDFVSWFKGKCSIVKLNSFQYHECYFLYRLVLIFGVSLYDSLSPIKIISGHLLEFYFFMPFSYQIFSRISSRAAIKNRNNTDAMLSPFLTSTSWKFLLCCFQSWGKLSNPDKLYVYPRITLVEIRIFPVLLSITHGQQYQRPWLGQKKLQILAVYDYFSCSG